VEYINKAGEDVLLSRQFTCFIISGERWISMNNGLLTLNEICVMTGKSYTSVLRYVKSGKLKSVTMTIQGKPCYKVKKSDLERFIEKHGISMNIHSEDNRISMNNQGISMKETFKEVVRETIAEERNQLMKPIEEQALYRLGILENEVKHLQAEKTTLRQENELLREQVKALPGPAELETKENIILLLQKEKEEQIRKAEGLNQVLLDNANNIKELAKEKDNFQSALKEQEATIREKERALKDLEELHRAELEQALKQAEEEKKQIVDIWKKELEEAKKPWWKFW